MVFRFKNRFGIKLAICKMFVGYFNLLEEKVVIKNIVEIKWEGEFACPVTLHNITEKDDWVCADISDNGVGMSVETREKMFDPFYTIKRSRYSDRAGTVNEGVL